METGVGLRVEKLHKIPACPLLRLGWLAHQGRVPSEYDDECLTHECAWWVKFTPNDGACAVLILALELKHG